MHTRDSPTDGKSCNRSRVKPELLQARIFISWDGNTVVVVVDTTTTRSPFPGERERERGRGRESVPWDFNTAPQFRPRNKKECISSTYIRIILYGFS
jgi:hypothetical protein